MTRDPKRALQAPIVAKNTLWTTDDPRAYGGIPLAQHPNLELARYDATGDGRVDDARWSGALGAGRSVHHFGSSTAPASPSHSSGNTTPSCQIGRAHV